MSASDNNVIVPGSSDSLYKRNDKKSMVVGLLKKLKVGLKLWKFNFIEDDDIKENETLKCAQQ